METTAMIGLDTNILVRYLVRDDKAQSLAASRLIESGEHFLVNTVVLCEIVWVLESCYGLKKNDIATVIEKILSTRQITVENSDLVWQALEDFASSTADFSDCLIGVSNQNQGCPYTATFDRSTKTLGTFRLLPLK